jgi:hypothetical protein
LAVGCGSAVDRGIGAVEELAHMVVPCDSLTPQPISQETLVETFRAEGIRLYPEPSFASCTDLSGRTLRNLIDRGPDENRARHDAIFARQGDVFCSADPAPLSPKDLRGVREWKIRDDKTELVFANVQCQVYTDNENRSAALRRLRAAMERLAAEHGKTTATVAPDPAKSP